MPAFDIDGTSLNYIDQGSGPVLLLGHSFLWDHRMWAPQIERWSQHYRVIATDAWAHGQSGGPPAGATLDTLADHHAELLRSLKVSHCAVVGLSMGGMWALRLALRHPDLVAGLVVLDAAANAEPSESAARFEGLFQMVAKAGEIPASIREQIVPGFFSPATVRGRPEVVRAFNDELAAIDGEQIAGVVAVGRLVFGRDDIVKDLASLTVPAFIGVGADDIYRPVAESRLMASLLPDAELSVWPEAGHIANLDQPGVVSVDIEIFLSRIFNASVSASIS